MKITSAVAKNIVPAGSGMMFCVVHQKAFYRHELMDLMGEGGECLQACPICVANVPEARKIEFRDATTVACLMCKEQPSIECKLCGLDACDKHRVGPVCLDCAGDFRDAAEWGVC